MRFFRRYRFVLAFLVLLVFCSIMVIHQFLANQDRHVELRESFILLYIKGYKPEAQKLYDRLLEEGPRLSNKQLIDDFQRTLLLVDPMADQTAKTNLLYNYHWYVSTELEKRSESTLLRALELAGEKRTRPEPSNR
jgi:hypothetical protein